MSSCKVVANLTCSCRNKASPLLSNSWGKATSSLRAFSTITSKNQGQNQNDNHEESWSQSLSFTSPEADFTSMAPSMNRSMKEDYINFANRNEYLYGLAYSLSSSSLETDLTGTTALMMDLQESQQEQQRSEGGTTRSLLDHAHPRDLIHFKVGHDFDAMSSSTIQEKEEEIHPLQQGIYGAQDEVIPHSLQEASMPNDPRAIVITEAEMPFRIVSVNHSWEQLCGYTQKECRGETLRCIQGKETNKSAVTALMAQLLKGEEAGTLLTNYTKDGRKFHNRLMVGPLKNNDGLITHFVGVLKEVNEKGEFFNDSKMHA